MGATVATIFHKQSDTDMTIIRQPFMGRSGTIEKERISPANPTKDKLGRSRGFRYPGIPKYVKGQYRDDFVSDTPYYVATEGDELTLTGVNVGKAFRLPRANWTPAAGPKGLGRIADGTVYMLEPRPAKIIVQFAKGPDSKQPPGSAPGGSRPKIRDQITDRAAAAATFSAAPEPGRVYDPSQRPATSHGGAVLKPMRALLRPGTSAGISPVGAALLQTGGRTGTEYRIETARVRSQSALEMSLEKDGGLGGGGQQPPPEGPRSPKESKSSNAGTMFVKNSACQRYEVCKQSFPLGMLAEERMMRPLFALAGGNLPYEPNEPMEGTLVTDPGLREGEYTTKKMEKVAISAKFRAGNGNIVTWGKARDLGTPPWVAQRRRLVDLANARKEELSAEARASRRPATVQGGPRLQTPAWMGNAVDMANIGLFSDTIDYASSKLIAASALRAKQLQIRNQIILIGTQVEVKAERAKREREAGAIAKAETLDNLVEQLRRQQEVARADLEATEREIVEQSAGLNTARPQTGLGVLPAGMLETDLRRILRSHSRIELLFLMQSVGVPNTLYPDRNLGDLTQQELSNCIAASPIARGKLLEMMRKTPARTVKMSAAGFLIAADQGGTVKPKWLMRHKDGTLAADTAMGPCNKPAPGTPARATPRHPHPHRQKL